MADANDKPGKKPKLDPADLKARLGLKKKSVAPMAPLAPTPEPEPAPVAASPPEPAKPSAASVEEARQRAAQASAEAGPAVEDFSVIGQEATPLPAALPGGVQYVSVGADETYPGKDKKQRTMLIALTVVVGAVGFFIGYLLSGASLQSAVHERVVREANTKLEMLESHKSIHARIAELKAALATAIAAVDAAPAGDEGGKVVETQLATLLPLFKSFEEDNVYIEPTAVLGDVVYNGALARELVAYALATEKLHEGVGDALSELQTYLPLTVPPGGAKRLVLVKPLNKPHPEQEGVEVPFSEGAFILETSPPGEVTLMADGREVGKEWQIMVRTGDSEEDKQQVRTTQVMDLDVGPLVEGQSKRLRAVVVGRFVTLIKSLHELTEQVNAAKVIETAQKWKASDSEAVKTD